MKFLLFNSFMFFAFSLGGQNYFERMHELFPKEVIKNQNIQKVIFHYSDGESQLYSFNELGVIELEIESKNYATGDTTYMYYRYLDDRLDELVFINQKSGDTLSHKKYFYENNLLKYMTGYTLSNLERSEYFYDENNNLSKRFNISFISSGEIMQKEEKYFDEKERPIKLIRYVGENVDILNWTYFDNYIQLKEVIGTYDNWVSEQKIEFNEKLQLTKFIKDFYYPENQHFKTITELFYDENDVFSEMKVDGSTIISVEIIRK